MVCAAWQEEQRQLVHATRRADQLNRRNELLHSALCTCRAADQTRTHLWWLCSEAADLRPEGVCREAVLVAAVHQRNEELVLVPPRHGVLRCFDHGRDGVRHRRVPARAPEL